MEPSKIVTISYDKQAFESLPRCLQRQAGTKENWEKIQQECEARATAREEAAEDYYNSRAGILSLKELERREREAQPRYKDSKSALQAMKQYLKSNPPLPPALSDESWKDRQAKLRRYYEIRRMRKIVMKVLAGNEASVQESERADAREVLAGVETAMAQSDAGVGHQDQDGNGIGASSKGSKTPGAARGSTHVSSAKALEEEGWVVIPTSIVESKCQDDGIESDSDYEYNGESGEEDQEEDDSDE